jgi:isochorismate hydrolase
MDYLNKINTYNVRQAQINPTKAALFIIDIQNFFNGLVQPILSNVQSLLNEARRAGITIIFTRHGHKNLTIDGGRLAQWWGELAMYGSPQWELISPLQPEQGDVVIDKIRYSAFFGTPLDSILRSQGIEDVIITGVMTNCCCETTAREAFMRDYRVFFVADATNTLNDDLHLATLKNLAYGFAYIVNTAQVHANLIMAGT